MMRRQGDISPELRPVLEALERHKHMTRLQTATQVVTLPQEGRVQLLLEPVPTSTKSIKVLGNQQLVRPQVLARLLAVRLQHPSRPIRRQTVILVVTQPLLVPELELPGLELMNIRSTRRGNLRKNKRPMTRHLQRRRGNTRRQ